MLIRILAVAIPLCALTTAIPAQALLGESVKLTASNRSPSARFGDSVALDGDTLVVGASRAPVRGWRDPGAVYVFVAPPEGWGSATDVVILTASDSTNFNEFGTSVSISGDTIVVGARFHDTNGKTAQGAAYVFVKPTNGWSSMTETAKLTASDGAANDQFGISVAIDGDTIAIGAPVANNGGAGAGAVYVFERPANGWVDATETAELTGLGAGGQLGTSVAIDDDTIVAGAVRQGLPGAVAVFTKPTGGWNNAVPDALLTASEATVDNGLGTAVAVQGDVIAAGALWAPSVSPFFGGAVYVFEKPAGGWVDASETAKLTASDSESGDEFGVSVALDGNVILAGAERANLTCRLEGKAYMFQKTGAWSTSEVAQLTASDAGTSDQFGCAVAIQGSTLVCGSRFAKEGANPGGAYVFETPYAVNTLTPTTLASISPSSVSTCSLPQTVTLTGSNLGCSVRVHIGGLPPSAGFSASDTSVTFQLGNSLSPGTYPVTVTNRNGSSNQVMLTITPSAAPTLASIDNPSLVNRALPRSLVINGTDFDCTTTARIGNTPVFFQSPDPTTLLVSVPAGFPIGTYQVAVDSSFGTSNALSFDVVGSHPSVLLAPGLQPVGTSQNYRIWTDAGWSVQYLVSATDGTTALPGIVSFEIGGGTLANVFPFAVLVADATGLADVQVTVPPGFPLPFTLYWEALTTDPGVPLELQTPLETSNRAGVLTLF